MTLDQAAERIYRIPSVLAPAALRAVARGRRRPRAAGRLGRRRDDRRARGAGARRAGPGAARPSPTSSSRTPTSTTTAATASSAAWRPTPSSARARADVELIQSWDLIARERYGWYRQHGLDYPEAAWKWLQDAGGPDTPHRRRGRGRRADRPRRRDRRDRRAARPLARPPRRAAPAVEHRDRHGRRAGARPLHRRRRRSSARRRTARSPTTAAPSRACASSCRSAWARATTRRSRATRRCRASSTRTAQFVDDLDAVRARPAERRAAAAERLLGAGRTRRSARSRRWRSSSPAASARTWSTPSTRAWRSWTSPATCRGGARRDVGRPPAQGRTRTTSLPATFPCSMSACAVAISSRS